MRSVELQMQDEGGVSVNVESGFIPANVVKPIWSAGRIASAGYRAVIDDDGSYVMNKRTGQKFPLVKENNVYKIRVDLTPGQEGDWGYASPFWQPRR